MLSDRQERLRALARLARENDLTPLKNTFAGFIYKIACTNFGLNRSVAKQDLNTLVTAWNGDQWKTLLYEDEEEIVEGTPRPRTFVQAESETKKFLATMKPSGEPVKHVEQQEASVVFDRPMTRREIAITMYSKARSDMFDGIGRVLLSDTREFTNNKKMSMADMADIWQNKYPTIEISQATGNVMLVYFDGKEATRLARRANTVIQPTAPVFKPSETGDVYDDTED